MNIQIIVYIIFGLFAIISFWLLISSILDHQSKLTPAERKKIKLEKQEKLKQEYEEKKRAKKELENKLKQEQKNKKSEKKGSIFSFLKHKKKINDSNKNIKDNPIKNDYVQENDILDKLNNLTEKLKDI
jgi:uncharacterized membrane protein YhiD involved in acid resistance